MRELRNAVDAALQRTRGGRSLELPDLPAALSARFAARLSGASWQCRSDATPTRAELERILRQHDWNVTKVAALFGRDRKQIYRWCKALGIEIRK